MLLPYYYHYGVYGTKYIYFKRQGRNRGKNNCIHIRIVATNESIFQMDDIFVCYYKKFYGHILDARQLVLFGFIAITALRIYSRRCFYCVRLRGIPKPQIL